MKQPYQCYNCNRTQWSGAAKPKCKTCGKYLVGPVTKGNCNACGRELINEREDEIGLCKACTG